VGREDDSRALLIEIRANRIDKLFPDLDPLPLWPKALDKDVDEYVVRLARTARRGQPIEILVILPEMELETKAALELPSDFARYFVSRADLFQSDLSQLFRDGRRFLAIGMSILVACLVLAQIAGTYLAEGPFRRLVEQSLPILGWVANWRPLEIFLYDWWPLARRRDLYRRLSTVPVDVKGAGLPVWSTPS
jgi:hypothetical protein